MHGDGTPGAQNWTSCLMPLGGSCALWAQPNQIATLIWVHLDEVLCAWLPWLYKAHTVHGLMEHVRQRGGHGLCNSG